MSSTPGTQVKLTAQDWERVLRLGAQGHSSELEAELARVERAIATFEKRYGMPLSHLEKDGLPAEASFEMHEDYIEWSSWDNRRKDLLSRLAALQGLSTSNAS